MRIETPVHQQISKLVKLKQISGADDFSIQELILKSLDHLFEENGLHSLDDLAKGVNNRIKMYQE